MGCFLVRGAREASSTATWWTLKLLCRSFWSCLRSLVTMILRVLEIVFFLYFASHIPITLFIDLQALLPQHVYPQQVSVTYLHNSPPALTLLWLFYLSAAERCPQVVLWRVQRPDGGGPAGVVQVLHLLRGPDSAALLPRCSLRLPERWVNLIFLGGFGCHTRVSEHFSCANKANWIGPGCRNHLALNTDTCWTLLVITCVYSICIFVVF